MCGFAGQFRMKGLTASPDERLRRLRAMGQQLARRGPDDEQFYDDGLLSLVFRRLSIIDLKGGRQPIWNEDHSVLTTVNGEIYNHEAIRRRLQGRHAFASHSDSEVVVHLFEDLGASLMQELNGMFAFLVWDTRTRRLLLARDRLGIKPLFYAWLGDSLIFASELKALLAHPDCPRELEWRDIELGSGPAGHIPSFIRGVHHLPGGHYLMLENGVTQDPRAYWSIRDHFPIPGADSNENPDHYVERYGELLEDSVQKYLMSDVPVGLFLSGGIDSSLLAALAAKAQGQLHCFTVVEDSIIESGDVDQAVKVTGELGLPHYPVRYNARTVLDELDFNLDQFEYLLWAVETPRFSLEWLLKHELHRFSKTRIPALKVMLLGQGADEFAGGYSRSMGRENQSWRAYVDRIEGQDLDSRRFQAGIPPYLLEALADGYPALPLTRPDAPALSPYHRHMLKRISVLQGYNLWHEDRTSASQGVEARVPFLDHRLVELLASVPASLHETLFFDKHIVRRQLQKSLPSYPPDKLKVKLYIKGRTDSIRKLRTDLVRRIFPAFRDKYLDQDGAIFSGEKLTGFYQELIRGNASSDDLAAFFDCMAIQIFVRMCATIPVTGPPIGVNPPSPLPLWHADALS